MMGLLSGLHFGHGFQNRVGHVLQLFLAQAVQGQVGEALVEHFLTDRAGLGYLVGIHAHVLDDLEPVQGAKVGDLGHASGFQLLFQHLDIAAGLCRVDLELIQVEGGLGFFVAQQLGNDGIVFCEAAVEVSGSGGTLGGAFLNACRVDASLPLLRDTALSMEDISHRVGFSSASRYSKVFKQHKGISPLQYRKASNHTTF